MKKQRDDTITSKMHLGYALHKFIKNENNQPCNYIFIEVNPAFEKHTGLKSDNIIGKKVTEVLPEVVNDKFDWIVAYSKVAFDGENLEFEQYSHSLKRWYKIKAYQPKYGYFITLIEDITDQKETERELEIFKTISDSALYGKAIADTNGYITYVNNFFANIHGYQPEELMGKPISIFHTKKQLVNVNRILDHLLETGSFDTQEIWHKHKNGTEFPMLMSGIVIKDREGKSKSIATSAADITDLKMMETTLEEREDIFGRMLSVLPDMISIQDTDMNILYSNWKGDADIPEAKRILKSKCYKAYRDYDYICPDCRAKNVLQTKVPFQSEELTFDGRWVDLRVIPILDDENNVEYFFEWVKDITKRKENEKRIKQLKKEFEIIFEGSQDSIYLIEAIDSETFVFKHVNNVQGKITGIPSELFIGKTLVEVLGNETGNDILKKYKKCYELRKPIKYEAKREFVAGTVYLSNVLTPIIDDNEVRYLVGSSRDITTRKQKEKQINNQKQRLTNIIEGANVGTWEWNVQTNETIYNEKWAQIVGCTLEEISPTTNKTWEEFIHPEDKGKVKKELRKHLNGKIDQYKMELRMKHKDGYWVWIQDQGKVITWTKDGKPEWVYGTHQNITESKQAEARLRASEEKFKSYIQNAPDGIFITNENGKYIEVNRAACEITGYSEEELLNMKTIELIQAEYTEKATNHFQTVNKYGFASEEVGFITKSGERRFWTVDAVKLAEGLFLGFAKDTTKRRDLQDRLQERIKELACLYNLSKSVRMQTSLEGVFYDAVELIQTSWKYPKITRGKIVFNGNKYVSESFKNTCWKQSESIVVNGEIRGTIEVYYLKECPELDRGPFMKEEWQLLKEMAKMLGEAIERREAREQLQYKTFHDELTGLYNRTYLNEVRNSYDTKKQLPLSIIVGDVNELKMANDTFGHKEGDKLLKIIARIIERSCRQKDLVVRTGGDEFLVLLPQTTVNEVKDICIKIKDACNKVEGSPIKPGIALGWAIKTEISDEFDTVLKKAEDNMYQNKVFESGSFHNTILISLETMLRETTNETLEHSQRVKKLAVDLGKVLDLSGHQLDILASLANLHDLGKIGISKDILQKPGPLNANEWEEFKRHPEIGYEIAYSSPKLREIAEGVLSHHERWDGDGYPQEIAGEEIPLLARIISIVDAYDVMTRGRPYKKALGKKESIDELKRCAGSQFDPELVDVFIEKVLLQE